MLFYLKEACGKTFCKAEHSFFFLEGIFLSWGFSLGLERGQTWSLEIGHHPQEE